MVKTTLLEPPDCPDRRVRWAGDESYSWCTVADKQCVLDGGYTCDVYEDYLHEVDAHDETPL